MNMRKVTVLVLMGLCFCTLILYLLVDYRQGAPSIRANTALETSLRFSGRLTIQSMSDLRVAGRKIILCGVSFTKSKQIEKLVLESARRAFQGTEVKCVQVGGGTPCDGKAAKRFGDAMVAQCFVEDQGDLALRLRERGFLCDLPAQSGGRYKGC